MGYQANFIKHDGVIVLICVVEDSSTHLEDFVKKLVLSLSILLLGLLVACDGTNIVVTPPTPPAPTAGSSVESPYIIGISDDNQSPSDTFAIDATAGAKNFYYRITIPGDSGGDGVWFELAPVGTTNITDIADIVVVAKNNDGNFEERLRSIGPESFGAPNSYGNLGELQTSAIVPVPVNDAVECRGPCVFVEYPSTRQDDVTYYAYVVVRARAGNTINYKLYTYAASYYDETENINNQCSGLGIQSIKPEITVIGTNPDYTGAIENINDTDCFLSDDVVNASVDGFTIELPAETTIAITAEIYKYGANGREGLLATCNVSPSTPTCTKTGLNSLAFAVKVKPTFAQAAPYVNAQYSIKFF